MKGNGGGGVGGESFRNEKLEEKEKTEGNW